MDTPSAKDDLGQFSGAAAHPPEGEREPAPIVPDSGPPDGDDPQ